MQRHNTARSAPRARARRRPREWGAIADKLDEVEQNPDALDVDIEDFDDNEDACDPTEFVDEDNDEV